MVECHLCRRRATHTVVVRPLELPPHRPIKGQVFRRVLCAACAEHLRDGMRA